MIKTKKKKLLCEFVDYICENCHQPHELSGLEIHRINEEFRGGTYDDFRNLKVLCRKCHKKIHANQFPNVRSK